MLIDPGYIELKLKFKKYKFKFYLKLLNKIIIIFYVNQFGKFRDFYLSSINDFI